MEEKTYLQLSQMSVQALEELRNKLIVEYNQAIKDDVKFDTAYLLTVNTVLTNKHRGIL